MNRWVFGLKNLINGQFQKISHITNKVICRPSRILIHITSRCNAKCQMCDYWKPESQEKELDILHWKIIVSKLRDWLGPFFLNISGGEPFLKNGVFDFLRFAHLNGIKTRIISNGILLDKEMCDQLLRSPLNFLTLSLDSLTREVHDKLRGVSGSFEQVVSTLRYLATRQGRKVLGISTIILKENLDELVYIAEFTTKLGLDNIIFQALLPNLGSTVSNNETWITGNNANPHWITDYDKLDMIIDRLISLKLKGYPIFNSTQHLELMKYYYRNPELAALNRNCFAGYDNMLINANGDVYLCHIIGKSIGNLLLSEPHQAWNSKHAQKERLSIRRCRRSCFQNCFYRLNITEKIRLFCLFSKRNVF